MFKSNHDFDSVAPFYQMLAMIYSGGGILRTKLDQISEMPPQCRVLYAGGGTGEDAVAAARAGHRVTLIDSSQAMISRARRRAQKEGIVFESICRNLEDHRRFAFYDVVTANYFLNVFERNAMREMLSHLMGLVRPNGRIFIADFARPKGKLPARVLQEIYHAIPLLFFALLSRNALHAIYDYEPVMREAGLRQIQCREIPVFGRGPAWLATYSARRVA